MQIYEAQAIEGKHEQGKMDNKNEFVRKSLANKYKDMG